MIPKPLRTSLRDILPLVKARLVARDVMPGLHIRDCIDDRLDVLPLDVGDQDLWLRLAAEQRREGYWEGAAELDFRVKRLLRCTLRTRNELDEAKTATDLLYGSGGHIEKEDAIIKALHGWHVTDADDNELTDDPLEYLDISEPENMPARPGWGASVILFAVPYIRQLP